MKSDKLVGQFIEIVKSDDVKHYIEGWANIALMPNGEPPIDWQGDVITPEALEEASIEFMKDYRLSGIEHRGEAVGVVVMSMFFSKERQLLGLKMPSAFLPQGWYIVVEITSEELFQDIAAGKYQMFSIQGTGVGEPYDYDDEPIE